MPGKGLSVDLLHLGYDIFDRLGHQVREGRIFPPVRSVSKTLDEGCGQRNHHLRFL